MRAQLQLGGGHARRHNEIVLDTRSIEAHLPDVILGFFYLEDDSTARRARREFMRHFGLPVEQVPLVHIDFSSRASPAIRAV